MGVFLLIPPSAQKVPTWRAVWPEIGASGNQSLDHYFFACPGGSLTLISRPGAFSLLPGPSTTVPAPAEPLPFSLRRSSSTARR
jgi:hypothetical protein